MLLLIIALACGPSAEDLLLGDARGTGGHTVPTGAITFDMPPAFDPIAGAPIDVVVTHTGDGTHLDVQLLSATDEVMLEASVTSGEVALTWNGRTPAGVLAEGGVYKVRAQSWLEHPLTGDRMVVADGVDRVVSVRAGFSSAWAEDDGGASAQRVPLYWHGDKAAQDADQAFASIGRLDVDDAERPYPDVADPDFFPNLSSALRNPSEPLAYVYDSRPILSMEVGTVTALQDTALDLVEVGVRVEGWTVLDGLPLTPGTPVTLQRDEPLGDTLGVTEEVLRFEFVVDDDGEALVLGDQLLPTRFYRLAGNETFLREGPEYGPWVAAIDPALRALEGTPPNADAVRNALVDWIFWEGGLVYDHSRGASAYVSYGTEWTLGHFYFSDFLERRFGTIVNCTDCAHILLTYANMLGVEHYYLIIQRNFPLNYLLAIGSGDDWLAGEPDAYSRCPFPPSGCGFSYHAVTTFDGADIWDATLALDGDADPVASPSELMMVHQVPADEYLWRLSTSTSTYYHSQSQGSLQ